MSSPRDRLNSDLLTLNFLNAIERDNTAPEIHCSLERTDELDQPLYVITSESRAKKYVVLGRRVCICFNRKRKAVYCIQIAGNQI